MAITDKIIEFLKNTLGHAVSGAGTGIVFEITQLIAKGVYDWNVLLYAALIGGSIGFFKSIIEYFEKIKTGTVAVKPSFKKYFGF